MSVGEGDIEMLLREAAARHREARGRTTGSGAAVRIHDPHRGSAARSRGGWELMASHAEYVVVRMFGRIDAKTAIKAAEAVLSGLRKGAPAIVLDIGRLEEFSQDARTAWEERLVPKRAQVEQLVLVGGSTLARMSLDVLGMKLGVEVEKVEGPINLSFYERRRDG